MLFQEKIHRSLFTTNDRQEGIDHLITSNLIGLHLSESFVARMEQNEGEGVGVPVEETPLPAKDEKFTRNFTVVAIGSPLGNRAFIHGREIFSREAAEEFFKAQNKEIFPYASFSEVAKKKIRALLSPESLPSRMADCVAPPDIVEYAKYYIEWLKKEIPGAVVPDIPPVNAENFSAVFTQLGKALEAQGIDVGELSETTYFPSEVYLLDIKSRLRLHGLSKLQEVMEHEGEAVAHLLPLLERRLEAGGYDPEIIMNFTEGLRTVQDAANASLDAIIGAGLEKRVEIILRQCAAQVSNPYSAVFTEAEMKVADTLVHSVQPRVLRNIQRQKTAILITDDEHIGGFSDILRVECPTWLDTGGKYEPKTPFHADHAHDFVLIAARGLDRQRLGIISRHECEHHRDCTQSDTPPYAIYYKNTLDECIADDRRHLLDVLEFLENITPHSSGRDKQRFESLVLQRTRGAKPAVDDFCMQRRQLLNDANAICRTAKSSFFAGEDEAPSKHYEMKYAQRMEVPAVIAHLEGHYGSGFIKALMPRLYETVQFHRAQSNVLRDW